MSTRTELPTWVDVGLIPLINLAIAFIVAGLVVVMIGENPFQALGIMLDGALGSLKGWSYMFYYATNFIFTGLCVAVAFHAGLFNIGGEGQAYAAGLGAAAPGLILGGALASFLPTVVSQPITLLVCLIGSVLVGAAWGWFSIICFLKLDSPTAPTPALPASEEGEENRALMRPPCRHRPSAARIRVHQLWALLRPSRGQRTSRECGPTESGFHQAPPIPAKSPCPDRAVE